MQALRQAARIGRDVAVIGSVGSKLLKKASEVLSDYGPAMNYRYRSSSSVSNSQAARPAGLSSNQRSKLCRAAMSSIPGMCRV